MNGLSHVVAQDVSAGYGAGSMREEVLERVSFELAHGTATAVVGPSGSGKTTLLSIIGGLERPDGGRLLVDGRDLGGLTRRELAQYRREQVGFVFQFFNLLPTLDARENVAMGLVPQGRSRRDRRRRADEALARVGLGGKAERLPHQLSGGEQQRVAVARAWAKEPALLLADEPTGNLDDAAGARVLDLLLGPEGAGAGRTVLVATHDGAIAARVSRVLTLEAHHVVET